jgi:2-polyprenyl-3-methyl-5-hydroxy-6-metoxy-1,4-benzoquinol methylase
LCRHLGVAANYDYTGVDISQIAVQVAAQSYPDRTWVVSPAEHFVDPHGATFDAVVFNEVLGYFSEPATLVRRYRGMLDPHGILVVSNFVPPLESAEWCARVAQAWQALAAGGWSRLDECQIWNSSANIAWRVAVFQAMPEGPAPWSTVVTT